MKKEKKLFFKRFAPLDPTEGDSTPSSVDKLTFMVKREVKQHLDAGKKFLSQGHIKEAVQQYQKAVETDPGCALCHFHLAYACHEGGDLEYARERYEKAVELEPTCCLFLEHLARLHFESQDYREAARFFHRASLVGQIQPLSLGLWGRALFEQGLFEQSIEAFEQLLEREQSPQIYAGANYWLAIANLKLRRIAAARDIAIQLLSDKNADHKILCDLGEHFIEAKCLSLARNIFERLAISKEEVLLVRLRLEDIRSIERQIDEMLPKLFDGDEERMLHQIHALKEFGNDRISKAMLSFIDSPSAPVRESVIRYQTAFGYDVPKSIVPLLKDPIGYVLEAAYDYFDKRNDGGFLDVIVEGLKDPIPSIRKIAARYVGRFGEIEKLPLLEMSLTDPANAECREELRKAVSTIKERFQKKNDALYQTQIALMPEKNEKSFAVDWRFWVVVFFQLTAITYFVYFLLKRL